jgi:hypothetical protein
MKHKAGSLKKINEIDKSLANITKMRGEKIQISKIRNEKGPYDHPKLNQEDVSPLNIFIVYNEIEAAITVSQKRKVQELTDSLLNSTRPLKKN